MAIRASVKLDMAELHRLRAGLLAKAADVVSVAAFRVQAGAQQNCVEMNVIDTGATTNSIRPEFAESGLRADIGPSTEYAIYPHEGYHLRNGRYISGRPFLSNALESEREPFTKAIHALGRKR